MASVYDIKLFVRDNGRVAVRIDNYFELRNRGMGFYTELRNAIILACMNVDRGDGRRRRVPIILPADSLRRPLMGKRNRNFDYNGVR